MKTDETNPQHWLGAARLRLSSADHLHAAEGASAAVVELLQEAVERYLKGYLIDRGWRLQRTHNLTALLDAAVGYEGRFQAFSDMAESLTDQFWAQHYLPTCEIYSGNLDLPKRFPAAITSSKSQVAELSTCSLPEKRPRDTR